jgi:OmpA-OmpF porin, OOP family
MKQKLTLFLSFLTVAVGAFAQSNINNYQKRSLFGIHMNALDVNTPLNWKNNTGSRGLAGLKEQDLGFSLSYWKLIAPRVDLSIKGTLMFHDYAAVDRNLYNSNFNQVGVELEPSVNIKAFNDESVFNAFLTVGIGGGVYSKKVGAYIPTGVGLQANIGNTTYFMLQAQYRFTLTKDVLLNNLFYSFGVAQRIGREEPKVVLPPPPPPVVDRDGDGILDTDDKCPDVPGLAAFQGCPDRDGDGITDADDKCPDVSGIAKYTGCPIPDTDGDGINDEDDKCVTVKGLARYQGCPIPDTDGDGINDEEDKCPSEKGAASNKGCPVLSDYAFNADNVQFETGSAKLTKKAMLELDKGVVILNDHPSLNVAIHGYTDNTGKPEKNLELSQKRADAVKLYLVQKGISGDRLAATGFGIENPVADNNTPAGRAKNRRVEFKGNN